MILPSIDIYFRSLVPKALDENCLVDTFD